MLRKALVFATVVAVAWSIRCFVGQQTVPGVGTPFQEMNCPTADYCFDNYVKRNHNGDNSYTITKDCGQPGKCFEEGCEGPSHQKRCCCVGDLCNSSNGLPIATAGILLIIFQNAV